MNVRIIIAILAVPVLASLLAWAMAWFVRSSMSNDVRVRRQAWLVGTLLLLATAVFSVVTSQSANARRWMLAVLGVLLAASIFRGVRFLLNRRAPKSNVTT